MAIQGHPKSMTSVSIESAYAINSLWSCCTVYETRRLKGRKSLLLPTRVSFNALA